jgi:hypothetical protein
MTCLAMIALLAGNPVTTDIPESVAPSEIAIHHEPPGCLLPEQWSALSARLEPAADVAGAWLHFRQQGTLYWYTAVLRFGADGTQAVLPKPFAAAGKVEYVIETLARSGSRSWSPCHVVDVTEASSCRGLPAESVRAEPVGAAHPPGAPETPPGFARSKAKTRLERPRSSAGPPVCSVGDGPRSSLGEQPATTPRVAAPATTPSERQGPTRLDSFNQGARLRVTTGKGRDVGSLLGVDAAGVTLSRDSGEPIRIPHDAIRRIETSLGPSLPGVRARWAGYGAVFGFVVGTIVSKTLSDSVGHGDSDFGVDVLGGLLFGVPAGAATGYFAAPREQWEPTRLPAPGPAARRDSLGFAIAVRF